MRSVGCVGPLTQVRWPSGDNRREAMAGSRLRRQPSTFVHQIEDDRGVVRANQPHHADRRSTAHRPVVAPDAQLRNRPIGQNDGGEGDGGRIRSDHQATQLAKLHDVSRGLAVFVGSFALLGRRKPNLRSCLVPLYR